MSFAFTPFEIDVRVAGTLRIDFTPACTLTTGDAVATGGTITTDLGTCEIVHTFTADGTFLLDATGTLPVVYTIAGSGTFDGDASSGSGTVTDTAAVTVASGSVEVRYVPADFTPAGGAPGHAGVAAWVTANSADVVGYWPMSDAAASGTMTDSGPNGLNGTYGSGMSTGTLDGETVANFDGVAADNTSVPYNSVMNTAVAGFAVIELDTLAAWSFLPARDGVGSRAYQWRVQSDGRLQLVTIGSGVVTVQSAAGVITASTRYTVGWWWDGTSMRLYVNGSVVATTATGDPDGGAASNMQFGFSTGGGGSYDGRLGSVLSLDTATATTIPDLHNTWVGA